MMDYYEELGLSRSASSGDIRHAYKQLVRLLHPDHCTDESLRPLAELQMKRLNGILEILTDAVARGQYDRESLKAVRPRMLISSAAQACRIAARACRTWIWPAAALAAVAGLIAFFRPARPDPVMAPPVIASAPLAASHPDNRSDLIRRQHRTTPPRMEPIEGIPEIGLPQESPLAVPAAAETRTTGAEFAPPQNVTHILTQAPAREVMPQPTPATLSGNWFFVPAARRRSDGLYPPQYIELRISEHAGMLQGKYRARYRVPDQAISPQVSFEFEGAAGPDGASLTWTGPGGAHGDVTLRLLTSGALEITWVANQLGSELGLISGTATLIRKME
jgi:hypothetical protein